MARRKPKTSRKSARSRARNNRLRKERQDPLRFELLESRQLLSGVTVGNALDVLNAPDVSSITALIANDGGDGISLREAITAANNTSGADTITFDPGLAGQTLTLTQGELALTDDVTIDGDTDGDNKADITISGNNASRVIKITVGTVNLDSLTITGGSGGGIFVSSGATLEFTNGTIEGNISDGRGAGISNEGTLRLINATVSGNSANSGGGIFNNHNATATLTNVTVSGNSAIRGTDLSDFQNRGGGIFNAGSMALTNSTVSGNIAPNTTLLTHLGNIRQAGGIYHQNPLATGSSITLTNSIVLGNVGRQNVNFPEGSEEVNVFVPGGVNSIIGGGESVATSVFDKTVRVFGVLTGVLANNSGPVQTIALKSDVNNPALDAGTGVAATLDARGASRNVDLILGGGAVDIGAFERQAFAPTTPLNLVVTTAADELDGFADSDFATLSGGAGLSVREAIALANQNVATADTITFNPSLDGATIRLTRGLGELLVGADVTIDGDLNDDRTPDILITGDSGDDDAMIGTSDITDAVNNTNTSDNVRVFNITGGTANLDGLTVTGGMVRGADDGGGILIASGATLNFANGAISGNTAGDFGGGINNFGTATLTNTTVSANRAGNGGGGINNSTGQTLTLTNTTVSGEQRCSTPSRSATRRQRARRQVVMERWSVEQIPSSEAGIPWRRRSLTTHSLSTA